MEENDYLAKLEAELQAKRKRLADSRAADAFLSQGGAQIALDVLDTQVTLLLTKITSAKGPVPYETYLNAHGGITALQGFRSELAYKAKEEKILNEEIKGLDEQVEEFKRNRTK